MKFLFIVIITILPFSATATLISLEVNNRIARPVILVEDSFVSSTDLSEFIEVSSGHSSTACSIRQENIAQAKASISQGSLGVRTSSQVVGSVSTNCANSSNAIAQFSEMLIIPEFLGDYNIMGGVDLDGLMTKSGIGYTDLRLLLRLDFGVLGNNSYSGTLFHQDILLTESRNFTETGLSELDFNILIPELEGNNSGTDRTLRIQFLMIAQSSTYGHGSGFAEIDLINTGYLRIDSLAPEVYSESGEFLTEQQHFQVNEPSTLALFGLLLLPLFTKRFHV